MGTMELDTKDKFNNLIPFRVNGSNKKCMNKLAVQVPLQVVWSTADNETERERKDAFYESCTKYRVYLLQSI